MNSVIREAVLADAAAIAPVHVRSWQRAYRGLMSDSLLDGLDVGQRIEHWASILSTPNEGARLVVEVDGVVVGFLVATRASPSSPDCAEVFSIYLDPDHWRGGLGARLLTAGVAALRAPGPLPVVLWVLDGNDGACRFYEAQGWRADGASRDDVMFDEVIPHVRYRLD